MEGAESTIVASYRWIKDGVVLVQQGAELAFDNRREAITGVEGQALGVLGLRNRNCAYLVKREAVNWIGRLVVDGWREDWIDLAEVLAHSFLGHVDLQTGWEYVLCRRCLR